MPSIGVLPKSIASSRGARASAMATSSFPISSPLTGCVLFGLLTIKPFNYLIFTAQRSIFFEVALYYDLPVYRDTYQLILKIFACTKDFPKEYKYTLGQDMKRDALQLVRRLYRANKATHKKEHLKTFLDEFEIIKLEIRLCADLKVLSFKKQAELSVLMDSIGKQVTGWRNAIQ